MCKRVIVVHKYGGEFDVYTNAKLVYDFFQSYINISYKSFMRQLKKDGSRLVQFKDCIKIERKQTIRTKWNPLLLFSLP